MGYWRMTYLADPSRHGRAGVAQIPEKPRHELQRLTGQACEQVFVGCACCRQFGYECGIQMVGSPRVVAKQSFGMVPPRLGRIVTALAVVAAIDALAQFTHAVIGIESCGSPRCLDGHL